MTSLALFLLFLKRTLIDLSKQAEVLFELIDKTYADPQVQQIPEIAKLLLACGQALQQGDRQQLVCTQLSNGIASYLLGHQFKAPKSVLKLYSQIEKDASTYRGAMSSSIWLNEL